MRGVREGEELVDFGLVEIEEELAGDRFHFRAGKLHTDLAAVGVKTEFDERIARGAESRSNRGDGTAELGGRDAAFPEPDESAEGGQVGQGILVEGGDEVLTLPAFELALGNGEPAADFLSGVHLLSRWCSHGESLTGSGKRLGSQTGSIGKAPAHEIEGVFTGVDASFELGVLRGGQHRSELRTGLEAVADEVIAGEEARGLALGGRDDAEMLESELIGSQVAVAGETVEAVELKVFVEVVEGKESLEGALLHLVDMHEAHVICDEGLDAANGVVGEAEAVEDEARHFYAGLDVAIEADAVRPAERGRFSDIVEQSGPCKLDRGRTKVFEQQKGVDPDIAFGVEFGRLRNALKGGDLRQNFGEEAGGVKELEASAGAAFGQDAGEFAADALGRNAVDAGTERPNCLECGGIETEGEAGGEADGAQHPEMILFEPREWVADGADNAAVEVVAAADEIDNNVGFGIEKESVDGEIAAQNVGLGAGLEADRLRSAAIEITAVGAKRTDLDMNPVDGDKDDPKLGANHEGAREQGGDLVGAGIGADVIILGLDTKQAVANAAADEVGLKSPPPQ